MRRPSPDAERARLAGAHEDDVRATASALRDNGPVVVIWSERMSHGERGRQTIAALLALARALNLNVGDGDGMIGIPAGANGRGLREVGCLPNMGPGFGPVERDGLGASGIAAGLGDSLDALILFQADPLRTHPDRQAWEQGLEKAGFVLAFSDFKTESVERSADVVLPAEAYAEKEGTVTHPDGRLQRLRQAIGHREGVRRQTEVLLELITRLSGTTFNAPPAQLSRLMTDSVPFYRGLSLDEIGGRGVRWQDTDAAGRLPQTPLPDTELERPPEPVDGLRLGTSPSLWASRETDHAAALRFLAPVQHAELAAEDAGRLGIRPGDEIEVAVNGAGVRARAAIRSAVPQGSVFLVEGTHENNATALTNGVPRTVEVRKP